MLEARGDDLKLQFVQQALLSEEQKFVKTDGDSLLVAQAAKPKKNNVSPNLCAIIVVSRAI